MRYWVVVLIAVVILSGVVAVGTESVFGGSTDNEMTERDLGPDESAPPTMVDVQLPAVDLISEEELSKLIEQLVEQRLAELAEGGTEGTSSTSGDLDETIEALLETVQNSELVIPYTPSAATCSGCVAVSTTTTVISEGTPQADQTAVDDQTNVAISDEEVIEEEPDVDCSKPVRKDRFASAYNDSLGRGKLWRLRVRKDEMGVLNFFSQWKAPNLWSKIKIRPGYNRLIKGGGDIVIYPAVCMNSRTVKKAMKNRSSDQKVLPRIPAKYIAKSKQDRFGQVR